MEIFGDCSRKMLAKPQFLHTFANISGVPFSDPRPLSNMGGGLVKGHSQLTCNLGKSLKSGVLFFLVQQSPGTFDTVEQH